MGFLAWIKNGAKGTYGLQMPAFFPASRTTYDNSNSGLSADKVQGAIDAVEGQIANSSDAYSASKAYSVGDYCIYNDTLYRCVTACSAASWSVNSGCFVADTVVNALGRIKVARITATTNSGGSFILFTNKVALGVFVVSPTSSSYTYRLGWTGSIQYIHIMSESGSSQTGLSVTLDVYYMER